MLMRVSVGIHKDNLDAAVNTYHLMSERMFTHASPTLFNSGTPRPQLSSCFLVAMKVRGCPLLCVGSVSRAAASWFSVAFSVLLRCMLFEASRRKSNCGFYQIASYHFCLAPLSLAVYMPCASMPCRTTASRASTTPSRSALSSPRAQVRAGGLSAGSGRRFSVMGEVPGIRRFTGRNSNRHHPASQLHADSFLCPSPQSQPSAVPPPLLLPMPQVASVCRSTTSVPRAPTSAAPTAPLTAFCPCSGSSTTPHGKLSCTACLSHPLSLVPSPMLPEPCAQNRQQLFLASLLSFLFLKASHTSLVSAYVNLRFCHTSLAPLLCSLQLCRPGWRQAQGRLCHLHGALALGRV